jgi:hypothetical protein
VRPILRAGIGWKGFRRVSTGISTPEGAPGLIEARQACKRAARPMGMGHGSPDEIAGVEAVEGAEHHLAGVGAMGGRCLSARGERRVRRVHADVWRSRHASTGCGLRARRTRVFPDVRGGIWPPWTLWPL